YRATTSGGPYTNIANTTELNYIDTNVTNGITYSYVITAVNNVGESIYSTEVNATPATTPDAPQTIVAIHANSQVSLTWDTPANDGGSAIIQYQVYRGMTSGGPYTNIANTTGMNFVDTNVTNGITYHYVITAINNEGESIYSTEVNSTPATVPTPPQTLAATSADSQVSLTWDTPANDGGYAIIHYQIYRTTTSGGPYTNIANTTELSYIDPTVSYGVTYYYVVTAVNNEGESGFSAEMSAALTTTTIPTSSTTTTTTSSISITSSTTTTTTTDSAPIGMLGFLTGIVAILSIRWYKKRKDQFQFK
ncbi:MAG: fibronectin type III domain-containing protein, partial [Candidatus Kariarchaeaceae archaeon]